MEITIRLDDPAWRLIGQRNLTLDLPDTVRTLEDVIQELGRRYPGLDAELRGQNGDMIPYSLFLNDNSVRWVNIQQAEVRAGDRLRVILPIAGG